MTSKVPQRQIDHHSTDHSRRYRAPSREAFPFRIFTQLHRRVGNDRVVPIRYVRQAILGLFWPCHSTVPHRFYQGSGYDGH
jgi:hypothetical protein